MKKPKPASERVAYCVEIGPSAEKDLDNLPVEMQERAFDKINALADNPHPNGSVKLKGEMHRYRIRIGFYRIIYRIEIRLRKIIVEAVRHRKDVYRRLKD